MRIPLADPVAHPAHMQRRRRCKKAVLGCERKKRKKIGRGVEHEKA
jgi:hypothetical protein